MTHPPFTMTSSATGEGHPPVPSSHHSTAPTNQPRWREVSAPAGVGRGDGVSHSEIEREKMEQRVRDAILNEPLHTSAVASSMGIAVPMSLHPSYHGETADQLRNRLKQPSTWDSRQLNPAGVPSNRTVPVYTYPYLQSSTPPPPSSLTPSLPNASSSSSPQQHVLQQSHSQEWTDYTSAPVGATQTVPTASTSGFLLESSNVSQSLPQDISEFDPIHS